MKITIITLTLFLILFGCDSDENSTSPKDNDQLSSFTYNGDTYHYVSIGNQEWTVENLKTSKYNDGTSIQKIIVTDTLIWKNNIEGAYCIYMNNESNSLKYGYLYNWQAIKSGKLPPQTGSWRVPSDEDWQKLQIFIGSNAGTKLKGKSGWFNNGNGTDDFRFNALPGGSYDGHGGFGDEGNDGYWWSSTERDTSTIWVRYIQYHNSSLYKDFMKSYDGLSVRLVRDKIQ